MDTPVATPTSHVLTPAARLRAGVGVGVVLCSVYAAVGVLTVERPLHTLETPLDRAVPLQPEWVLVYLLIYFLAVAPLAAVTDARALRRTIGAYATLYAVGTPMWWLFPVTVPRAPVPVHDLWTYGIALTRWLDPPTNCMPSMHVALSVTAALAVRRVDRAMGRVLLGAAALVTWSTVATEQHWVADGVVATVLAFAADWLWFGRDPLPADARGILSRRWHLTWFLAYVLVTLVLSSGWWLGWVPVARLATPTWAP